MIQKMKLTLLASMILLNACVAHEHTVPHTSSQSTTNHRESYTATVIKIADGDTITVQDNHGVTHKIRLAYIDAPETKQNYGSDSKDGLAKLISGKPVRVNVRDIDRYQREVALIEADGRDVNYRQVELGNAWHYTQYAKNQLAEDYQRYQAAMAKAKEKKLGLWSFARPQAPWDYRKQQRSKKNTSTEE